MKRIISAVITGVALLFLIQVTQFTPVSQIEYDGRIAGSSAFETSLTDTEQVVSTIELADVSAFDGIYEQMGSYYVGEDRKPINISYPMYFNENTGIIFLSDEGNLIDENFDIYTVREKYIVSDGTLYDQFQRGQGEEVYLFFAAKSGLFVNTKPMTVTTEQRTIEIPMNSIVNLEENGIRYYSPNGEELHYRAVGDVDADTAITMNDKEYMYRDLLISLGVLHEENPVSLKEEETGQEDKDEDKKKEQEAAEKKQEESGKRNPAGAAGGMKQEDGTKGEAADGNTAEKKYVAPQVMPSDYTSTVYSISSHIDISDPQGNLYKNRVELQIWNQGKIYMRKYLRKTQDYTINGLHPGQNYTMIVTYKYEDEQGRTIEKTFDEVRVRTKEFSTLNPIRFSLENGQIYAKRLQILNWKLESDAADEAVQNISRLSLEIEGRQYGLRAGLIQRLRDGETIEFQTDDSLPSNTTDITYTLHAYDSFGNELTLEDPTKTTRTCKQAPTVKLKTVSNKVSDVKFSIELSNPDGIPIENYRLRALDGDGNTVLTKALEENDNSLSFDDMDAGKTLRLTITGDYDVDDGAGMLTDQILADTQIVTVPLTNLGRFYLIASVKELYSDKAVVGYRLESRTNAMLVSLLQEMTVYVQAGDTVKRVPLTKEQLADLKNGQTIDVTYEGLNSKTTHALGADTIVHHGTTDYTDFQSVLSTKEFRSLRKAAWIETRGEVMKEDSISFEVRAIDPDDAVTDGYVGMRVMREDETVVDVIKIDTVQREDTGDGWVRYTYTINEGQYRTRPYTFQFYAVEYNEAYTAATIQNNKIIEQFTKSTPETISGTVGISALSQGAEQGYRRADMTYSIYDKKNHIKYKEYTFIIYKDEEEYARHTYTMDGTYYTHNERPISFDVPNNADYRIELWVINTGLVPEEAQMLGSVSFDTFYDVIPIRTIEDLYNVKENPGGHYLVLNDLDITADPNPQCIDATFTGQIDFAGHTVKTQVTDDWRYLFKENKGVLKGAVVETSYANTVKIDSGENSEDRASGFVLTNNGTISDVQLEFKGTTELPNDGIAGLVHTNEPAGVLENFVLHAASAMHTKRDASYGVAENSGTIRNGYAYGESINASYPNTVVREVDWQGNVVNNADYRKRVGGIAGYNAASGKISNVYSLVNVKMAGSLQLDVAEVDEVSVGNVLGLNNGTISSAYSYGEEVYQDGALAYGPAVGNNLNSGVTNNNVYYISDSAHSNTKLNKRVTKLQLYDEDFQNTALNSGASSGQFDTGTYPALGYYPHVEQSSYMPEQPLLPLPVVDTSEAVDIKSIEVLDYTDDTATVKLVLNNPGSGDVQAVSVKDIGVTRVVSFTHERKQTVVTVELKNPAKYYSVYSIGSVRIRNNYGGGSITRNYSEGAQEIFVDFFRPVETELDWSDYVIKNPKENYKLTNDLDFKGFDCKQLYMDSYYGKLDGRGHSISNINMNSSSYQALIRYLRGDNSGIYNLTVNHMTGDGLRALVYDVVSGAKAEFDHVFINDIELKGNNEYKAALVGAVEGKMTATNCGVNKVTIIGSSGNMITGGMFGRISGTAEIRNCYVVNLNMTTNSGYPYGAAGFVGEAYGSGVIEDCYANGQISGTSTYVGGFASEIRNNFTVSRCYADVDIRLNPTWKSTYAAGGFYYDGNITAAKLQNLYTQGNLYNEYAGGSMRRFRGTNVQTYTDRQIYAAEKQLINGQKLSENNERITGILTYGELAAPGTLETTVGLGSAYDYSQVEEGILPKLKGTDGMLLPGQEDLYIAGAGDADNLQIENVVLSEKTDLDVIMTIYVSHPKGYKVTGAETPNLTQEEVTAVSQGETTTAVRIKLRPKKYFDSYTVTKVSGSDSAGEAVSIDTEWKVECQFYKNIASYDDWQTISNDYENYRLTADIDFAGRGSYMRRNFLVNRFEGAAREDGTYPALQNINLELNGNSVPRNSANVFDTVRESFRYVKLENYSVSVSASNKYNSSVGFIRYTTGYIEDVDIDGMRLCAPTDGTEPSGPYYNSYVGFISQGYSWTVPVIRRVHTRNTAVCANANGGTIAGGQASAVSGCYVENASVYGNNYLGAVAGFNATVRDCVVVNSKVKGATAVGGVVGYSGGCTSCRVENVEVTATSRFAGGVFGDCGSVTSAYVSRSTIKAVYSAGGIVGNDNTGSRTLQNNYVADCTITASDGAAGGIYGSCNSNASGVVAIGTDTDTLRHNGVSNCTITGKAAGGIAGEMYGTVYDCFVRGGSVTGTQYAGGVAGRYYGNYSRSVTNNLIAADITATAGSAGGVIGYFDNLKNAAGKNQLNVTGNILAGGTVSGTSYAGGLIGETPADRVLSTDANITWNINLLTGGTIRAGTHASLQIGSQGGDTETRLPNIKELRAHSSVEVQNSRIGTLPTYNDFLVTKDELMTPSFYTGRGYSEGQETGMNVNYSYWGITGYADQGNVPITWMSAYCNTAAGTALPGIVINGVNYGEKAAAIQGGATVKGRDLQTALGMIPLPDDVSARMFAMRRMSLDQEEEIPELTVYPSDVDKLNLEFSHTGSSLAFFIGDDDSVLYPIDSKTKTVHYDFREPLKITITNYTEDKEITILPAGYARKVMVYQDEYYYITASGVRDSEGEISGDFIHLYNGKGLTRTGKIINMVTGASEGNVDGVGLMDEAAPLQTFTYGDTQVDTYGCYSVVDGTQEREMQIFLKGQELATVDGSLENVKDSVLFDTYQDKEYQVVLGKDGMLYPLKDELKMPENFDNSGIKYMASNLEASGHWLLVEYENGGVAGFDYVTGEMLFEDLVESDMDLMEFAASFLSMKASLLSDEMPEVYGTLEVLRDQLREAPVEDILAKMGEADRGADSSVDIDTADLSGGSLSSSEGGDGTGGVQENEESAHAFEQYGTQYIPFYDSGQSEYILYSSDELLDAGKESVRSENSKIAAVPALADYYAAPSTYIHIHNNMQGIILLGGLIVVISAGVVFLMLKKRRMR